MAKRRGRGEGSIADTGGGRYRAFAPGVPGKARPSKVCGTYREAQEWLRARIAAGPSDRGTFGGWLDEWFATREGVKAAATVRGDRQTADAMVRPALGGKRLAALTPLDCARFLAGLARDGRSGHERHRAGTLLRGAMNAAVALGRLGVSPMRGVKVPPQPDADKTSWTADELRRVVAAADGAGEIWGAMARLWADTGARPNEVLALTRADYDGGKGTVAITKARCGVTGQVKVPKTRAGRRTLPVSGPTRATLDAVSGGPGAAPLFPAPEGGFLWLSNLQTKVLTGVFAGAGVVGTPYTFRHTCATLLLRAGVSLKTVSERLGHRNVVTTLKNYAHCLPDDQPAAAGAMGALFGNE